MNMTKNLVLSLAATLLPLVGPSASAAVIGTTGLLPTGITRLNGHYSGNGGEFTIAGSGLDVSGYASTTSSGTFSFQTFCLEANEYTFSNPGSYVVNTLALKGGTNTQSGDAISVGTAWLYSQFATGLWEIGTPVYKYDVNSGRSGSAGDLQKAIWYLENENTGSSNAFVNAAAAKFGSLANAQASSTAGQFGVYVVNTFNTPTVGTGYAQDQLYYNAQGFQVPDGGASVMLLGLGLSGISLFRRHLKA